MRRSRMSGRPENIGLSHTVRFSAYSRQTEAGVARTLIARLKAAEFLPNSTEFLAFRGG